MPATKSTKPGPRPVSCLTCRSRRKKCDLARPHCERCLKSGFECLGYGDGNCGTRRGVHREGTHVPARSQFRPILPAVPARATHPEAPASVVFELSEVSQAPNGTLASRLHHSTPSIIETGSCHLATGRLLSPPNIDPTSTSLLWDSDHSLMNNQIQQAGGRRTLTHRSWDAGTSPRTTSNTEFTRDYLAKFVEALCTFIPPSIDSTRVTKEPYFVHIIHEYQVQRAGCCFMTPPAPVRKPMLNRLMGSKTMIWAMYLGAKLFQALDQDPRGTNIRGCIGWIDKFKKKFILDSNPNSSNDAADWLFAQLELTYLSFVMVNSISGYGLLRKALPRFLHLVAVDPNLTIEHPDGSLAVSFPRAFGALQHELKRFIFYDTAVALVLGVPPLVEYGYDGECDPTSHGFEWVHGVPIPFVETISQVNSWRAGSRVPPLDDWRNLERRVLAWQPQPPIVEEDDTAESISRLAVQEGWRHVSLIYIYMAICGASSHDPRVQASIRQIIQLGGTVTSLTIGLHMFTHYVIAGLGARYEKHRSIIREKLISFKNKRVWLFRGPEFSQVLDHLWLGVGAGGAPVLWDDYIRSRRKKCDFTRPHCKGCLNGGFECLGYSDPEPCVSACRKYPYISISSSQPILPAAPAQVLRSKALMDSFTTVSGISEHDQPLDHTNIDRDSVPSILGIGSRSIMVRPTHPVHDDHAFKDFDRMWLQNQTQLTYPSHTPVHKPPSTEDSLETISSIQSTRDYLTEFIESLCTSIPPSVVSNQTINEARFIDTISEYQLQRASYWFMTPPSQFHGPIVNRLKSSKMMVWTVCLGVELFKTLNRDPHSMSTKRYIGWIDKLEEKLAICSGSSLSLKDAADHLMAQLEIVFLSFVAIGSAWGYNMFQKSLPGFLRLVATNPNLVVEHPNGNLLVSFPRTFGATQQELKRFILYDITTALVLGVPPLVEYGYDGECDPKSHGFQWVHGVPVTLVEVISQINSWRVGSTAAALDDWQILEMRVINWQPQPLAVEDQPVENVARLAVQEGWRHVALIYLYMGMCGVASDDPRVQASIAQIILLGESIANVSIGMHMLMHYVIAGLGAQYEQHRSIIREKLLSFKGKRVWLFRGPEFSRVLDHLWHGIGARGAPITWDDYIRSRCAVLPL